jgi:hypothetical protein
MVLERCLEIVDLVIAAYMQGKKIAVVLRMAYSRSESGEVFHHNLVHEVVLGVALASGSFAAVAVAVAGIAAVAEAQEWVGFAVDCQTTQT